MFITELSIKRPAVSWVMSLILIIFGLFVYIILKSSKMIGSWLGKSGINIIRKVFGIILLAIAVKLFTSNIGQLI